MKFSLPENHGLPAAVVEKLVFVDGKSPSLTDAQFDALALGVGRGESALVVSPTSTGKTHVAIWAILAGLSRGGNAVYLVTHRALARQKFEEFRSTLIGDFLDGDSTSLVMATGDEVIDAGDALRSDPLSARLLVATYEKYLALVCGSGLPANIRTTTVVCDEIQLVGDAHRGRDVEILLTLLRNAACRPLVGLSAVLERSDAQALADWLSLGLVFQPAREKHLLYECWTERGIISVRTDAADAGPVLRPRPSGTTLDIPALLQHLLNESASQKPIVVFCMKKRDTYDLARRFAAAPRPAPGPQPGEQLAFMFEDMPETGANQLLSSTISARVALHSADLTEGERLIVERLLMDGRLDVVFATSTLAAGVNFPFGTAVFAAWKRWDGSAETPIEPGEFHNMAGRAGRMGFGHERGRIVFAASPQDETTARRYLDPGNVTRLEQRLSPEHFPQVCLQLVASNLCNARDTVRTIVCGTLSGERERDTNTQGLTRWERDLEAAISWLVDEGMLFEHSRRLVATPFGKAVAQSGLTPHSGVFLLSNVAEDAADLETLLPSNTASGDLGALAARLFALCFRSPEFRPTHGRQPTRRLPFPLDKEVLNGARAGSWPYMEVLSDPAPFNATVLSMAWIDGERLRDLEQSLPQLSAGMLRDMFRDLTWVLHGLSVIATAATDRRLRPEDQPKAVQPHLQNLQALASIPRMVRRFRARVVEGLPDDVLWMAELPGANPAYRLSRTEILELRAAGQVTPERVMLGTPEADAARQRVFTRARPAPQVKANWLRDTCRSWKVTMRQQACARQTKRAAGCSDVGLIGQFHEAKGTQFERAFEAALRAVNIAFEKLDDGQTTGAPDYVVRLPECPPLVMELKSRNGINLVNYNSAVEVLAASEVHAHRDAFCVTLCHPGVDPSVAPVIAKCGRLCVVESGDFADALLRLCQGHLTKSELWKWLTTPGQALVTDLYYSNRQDRRSGSR